MLLILKPFVGAYCCAKKGAQHGAARTQETVACGEA
jgi:hypothetical protein